MKQYERRGARPKSAFDDIFDELRDPKSDEALMMAAPPESSNSPRPQTTNPARPMGRTTGTPSPPAPSSSSATPPTERPAPKPRALSNPGIVGSARKRSRTNNAASVTASPPPRLKSPPRPAATSPAPPAARAPTARSSPSAPKPRLANGQASITSYLSKSRSSGSPGARPASRRSSKSPAKVESCASEQTKVAASSMKDGKIAAAKAAPPPDPKPAATPTPKAAPPQTPRSSSFPLTAQTKPTVPSLSTKPTHRQKHLPKPALAPPARRPPPGSKRSLSSRPSEPLPRARHTYQRLNSRPKHDDRSRPRKMMRTATLDDVISSDPTPRPTPSNSAPDPFLPSRAVAPPRRNASSGSPSKVPASRGSASSTSSRLALSDSGETQALLDEVEYTVGGAAPGQPAGVRRASVVALLKLWLKSSKLGLNIALRARGGLDRILQVLTEPTEDRTMQLVLAVFLCVIVQDKSNCSSVTRGNVDTLLEIVGAETAPATEPKASSRAKGRCGRRRGASQAVAYADFEQQLIGLMGTDDFVLNLGKEFSRGPGELVPGAKLCPTQLALHSLCTACRRSAVVRGTLHSAQKLQVVLSRVAKSIVDTQRLWETKTSIDQDGLITLQLSLKIVEQLTCDDSSTVSLLSSEQKSTPLLEATIGFLSAFEASLGCSDGPKITLATDPLVLEVVGSLLGVCVNATNNNEVGCEAFADAGGLKVSASILHTLLCEPIRHGQSVDVDTSSTTHSPVHGTSSSTADSTWDSKLWRSNVRVQRVTSKIGGAEGNASMVTLDHFDLINRVLTLMVNCVELNLTNRLKLYHMCISVRRRGLSDQRVRIEVMKFLCQLFTQLNHMQEEVVGGDHVAVLSYLGILLAFVVQGGEEVSARVRGLLSGTFGAVSEVLKEYLLLQKDAGMLTDAFEEQINELVAQLSGAPSPPKGSPGGATRSDSNCSIISDSQDSRPKFDYSQK